MADKPKKPETVFVRGEWGAVTDLHRFAHEAMATTFEIIVQHADERYAHQAADAAFDELDRIEGELSRYIETSDVTRINHLPAEQALPLSPDTFDCLTLCAEMYAETQGVFDVTVGFLLDCWLDKDKKPRTPTPEQLVFARDHTGMHLIALDEPTHAIALAKSPIRVDLGGVGKGYAVDRMAELLREWSIDRALIHGGFSSVLALDAPEGLGGWPVTLSDPHRRTRTFARLQLERVAVSGSGLEKGQHIIDPRLARPIEGKSAAWSIAPDAARGDALSTAFMVMTPDEVKRYWAAHPNVRGLLVVQEEGPDGPVEQVVTAGPWSETERAEPGR